MIKKIAVCDDSDIVLRQTAGYLEQLQKEVHYDICPAYYSSGESLLASLPEDTDLLLMDIAMGGMDGIECSKAIRARGIQIPIVFITGMTEYALQGYAVHAFGFLEKPVTYANFAAVVKDALGSSEPARTKKVLVRDSDGAHMIDPDDIVFAEVYQHETSFHLRQGCLCGNVQLGSIEPILPEGAFFRCHKSYLVSLDKITFIGRTSLTMCDGSEIPLSKHRRKEFLDAYSRFMGVQFE